MNATITYLMASIVSLGIFYAAFTIFLRKEPLFSFNRAYLLSALLLSYLIPILTLFPEFYSMSKIMASGNSIIKTITLPPITIRSTSSNMLTAANLMVSIYFAGLGIFTFRLFIRLLNIYRLNKNGIRAVENESNLLWSDSDIPPFSFLNTMYLPVNLKDSSNLDEIVRHESVHIKSFHSFDILLTEVLQTICWFNPFIPLIGKSLRETHEFEADKAVINSGTDPVAYTRILFAQDKVALAVVLGNNFNYSLIKRRLSMFYKKNSRFARLKAIVVLPVSMIIVMIYAIGCQQSNLKPVAENEDSLTGNSSKVMLVKDSIGNEVGTAVVITDSTNPPPPPPPPPPAPNEKIAFRDPVYTVVENLPQFPGGDEARIGYITKNVKYPETAMQKGVQGTVYVSFIIEKDGRITGTKVIRGVEKSLDAEAYRVVNEMPKWKPGTEKGKPVRVMFNMPINFKLN